MVDCLYYFILFVCPIIFLSVLTNCLIVNLIVYCCFEHKLSYQFDKVSVLHYVYLFVLSYYFLSNLLALCLMPVSLCYWLTVCVCLMYINLSDDIAFCLSILHFVSCLCNFVLAGPLAQLFIIVLKRNCLTNNDLSCILDTTDTYFLDPWVVLQSPIKISFCTGDKLQVCAVLGCTPYQGSRKSVSFVSRIQDKSLLVRQFLLKTMIKSWAEGPAKTKLHRHETKCKILRQKAILSDILIYIRQTQTVSQ